jgi:predicted Zn-dependent protease
MSVALASQTALAIGAALLGSSSFQSQAALQAAAIATTVGVQLPNSRQQEAEADRIGIELAAKAGYNPHAAVTLWEKMIEATGQKGKSDFLSTHPAGEKRIESLSALIPQMMPYYEDKTPRPVYKLQARIVTPLLAILYSGRIDTWRTSGRVNHLDRETPTKMSLLGVDPMIHRSCGQVCA